MSKITSIILVTTGEEAAIAKLNKYLSENEGKYMQLKKIDTGDSGGNKHIHYDIRACGINYMINPDGFINYFNVLRWEYPKEVKLLISEERLTLGADEELDVYEAADKSNLPKTLSVKTYIRLKEKLNEIINKFDKPEDKIEELLNYKKYNLYLFCMDRDTSNFMYVYIDGMIDILKDSIKRKSNRGKINEQHR